MLLRRLLSSPELAGIDAVVLDEVHERALETDLLFAMVAELRELRPELRLVVMSATLDADRWAGLLGGAPVVTVETESHPLDVRWAPAGGARTDARGVEPTFLDHVAALAADAFVEREGNVLVFVPGARECDEVVRRLATRGVATEPLHGSLDSRAQDLALRVDGARRVIVATSVAESSLTVPGVRTVVDSGLAREPRVDTGRGMTGLVTVVAARSSAEQRAGRAARLGPGLVVRCLAQADWAGLRPYPAPEIQTTDLTQTALDLAAWGSPGGQGLALPDPPPPAALAAATATLLGLGALGQDGRPTALGRRLATLPVEPRLGRALLEASSQVGTQAAAEVVALLAGDERVPDGDLVAAWRQRRHDGGRTPWRREAQRLERLVPAHGRPAGTTDDEAVALVVATAFPDRLARRRGDADSYLLASGTGAELPRGSGLAGVEWLAVAEVARTGDRAMIRSAAPLSAEAALAAASGLVSERVDAAFAQGRVTARRIRALGAIELSLTPVRPTLADGRAAVARALVERGLREVLGWGEGVEALRRRLALLHRELGEPWPDVSDAALAARADEWLEPELDRLAQGRPAAGLDLVSALRRLLPWPAAGRLDQLAPERVEVPTGSRIRLAYPAHADGRVVLAVKLQECLGLVETPRVADGRVPVLLHLLSPAGRPLAVTDDLASFWRHAYPGVRAENRGRYPKHPWPEDPLTAPPRRGTTRSRR